MNFLTLDDIDVAGKRVLVRVDINSPYDEKSGSIVDNERIMSHSKTVKELSEKGAMVVVLGHQGRKDEPDFTDMSKHAKFLSEHSGRKIEFIDDIAGEKAVEKIKGMQKGDIILLENVRKLDDETKKASAEEHSQTSFVKTLAPLFDYFVQDGFSVCHRPHASVVGFAFIIKSAAGRALQKELESLEKVKNISSATFVLGGAKPEEDITVMKFAMKNPDNIIMSGGIFGLLCTAARGIDLGNNMEKLDAKAIEELKPLVQFPNMMIPADHVNEKEETVLTDSLPSGSLLMDIGPETARSYCNIIAESKAIFAKGPMGKYEDEKFANGTRKILEAIASSDAFSLIGGGNMTDAISRFNIKKESFSHVSLAGGALLEYISGGKLPGLEVLEKWA